ncbi:MAG: cation-translocating P-type ATPase C-terminal domain-containing protein, partial [Nitrospirota bacterium]
LCRSERSSAFASGALNNRLLLWGIATELALILWIDYSRWGNRVFGTAPIPPEVWLFVVPFAAAMLALEELRKWIARRWRSEAYGGRGVPS